MLNKKNKILVVGGTGFIGFNILKYFLKKKFIVYSLSKNKPQTKRNIKNVNYLYGDISNYKNILFLKKINFNYVINCGGYVNHKDRNEIKKNHYIGCKNLYKVFEYQQINKFIQIGSSLEYGKIESPQKETSQAKVNGYYGQYKLAASKYLMSKKNFPFVILRLYQLYGPYQDSNRFIPFIINNSLNDKKFPCSESTQFRDFLFIDDLMLAIFKSLKNNNLKRKIINIGYGRPIQLKTVINFIMNKIKKGKPKYGLIAMRPEEQKICFPNINVAKKILKWKPKTSFQTGIVKTIKYYKKEKAKYDHR
jgi:nucleoside-diphosphate-sugar epimerase